MPRPTNAEMTDKARRWNGAVEREMIRRGVRNAYAAADRVVSGSSNAIDVELSVGDTGDEPWVELFACWDVADDGMPVQAMTVDLNLGWPRRRMFKAVDEILGEYAGWLSVVNDPNPDGGGD